MEKADLEKKLRKSEFSLVIIGLVGFLVSIIYEFSANISYYGFSIGYVIGAGSYFLLVESYLRLSLKKAKLSVVLFLLSNLKLIGIATIVYLFYKYSNFNILHIILGIFISQFVVMILIYKFFSKKTH